MRDEAMQLRHCLDAVGYFHQKGLRIIGACVRSSHSNETADHGQAVRDPMVGFSAKVENSLNWLHGRAGLHGHVNTSRKTVRLNF
jgi:hypothetical protein